MLARKTVTVLFCDVADSTPLGEHLDPESLQRVMARWFAEARRIIELHGGTVEKFIGDEVMAVFGVPRAHEDDALRAVRAAAEMRESLRTLNEEMETVYGVRLEVRMGINTGEVVAGDPASGGTFVTGEAVNLAKRLEQAAGPGEILVGKATYPLVRDAVRAGPLQSFQVKGKAKPVAPWRLDRVDAEAAGVARRLDALLVGRNEELAHLRAAYDAAVDERACRLLTVLGAAGIGKSRLATELAANIGGEARVLSGRCLPYGEGITFWPLVDMVRALGGDEGLAEVLAACEDSALVAERVRAATGTADAASGDELFWAVRRLVETLAAERPLLLVLEDIHWAEPTFLDLIEYLHGWTEGAPVLMVCLARPELLERRPGWTAARPRVETLALEPLSEAAAEALLGDLGADLDDAARERILASAEGNPLYVEQMAALAETGEVVVPPTIQALLVERLDRLEAGERSILERAAIVGREFSRRQVTDLCPPELRADVGRHLLGLVRKELIRPHTFPSLREDGFRFRHALIRDAAYEGMPKESRALFHEWFADWLERNAGERAAELEEIVGYHLEQAVRLRAELGPADERARRIAARAVERLGASGRRALARADLPAGVTLLERTVALLDPESSERPALLAELGSALMKVGEFARADSVLEEACRAAALAGDEQCELRVAVERQFLRSFTAPEGAAEDDVRVAEGVIPQLERLGDHLGLAKAWRLLSEADVIACRWEARATALEMALRHARRTPEAHQEAGAIVALLAQALHYGPTPAPEAIERCRRFLAEATSERALQAGVKTTLAALLAMRGDFDDARALYAEAIALYEELGLRFRRTVRRLVGAEIERLAGDLRAAERELRAGYEALAAMGESGVRAVLAAYLADVLVDLGQDDEAERFARMAAAAVEERDVAPQAIQRAVRARVLSRRGDLDEATALAREAVDLAETTDFLGLQAEAYLALSEVHSAGGAGAIARELLDRARLLHEAKGNVAAARRVAVALGEPVA